MKTSPEPTPMSHDPEMLHPQSGPQKSLALEAGFGPCACGCRNFVRATEVRGIWTSIMTVEKSGKITVEGCNDGLRTVREPRTVRCDKCKRRRPNPYFKPNIPVSNAGANTKT